MRAFRLLSFSLLGAVACTRPAAEDRGKSPAASPLVFASFEPLAGWARQIGGPEIQVQLVCSAEEDPAECSPSAEVISKMQHSSAVFINGAGFEKWIDAVSLPTGVVVDTSAGFSEAILRHEPGLEHQHGPLGPKHKHEGLDGHTWLDPNLAKQHVEAMRARFTRSWPERATIFETRTHGLLAEIEKLHRRHLDILSRLGPPTVVASHPAYNYLGRRYGWTIRNVSIDPDSEASADLESSLGQNGTSRGHGIVLFETEPNPALAETLKQKYGMISVLFSPAERSSKEGDYVAVMNANLDRLEAALKALPVQE